MNYSDFFLCYDFHTNFLLHTDLSIEIAKLTHTCILTTLRLRDHSFNKIKVPKVQSIDYNLQILIYSFLLAI